MAPPALRQGLNRTGCSEMLLSVIIPTRHRANLLTDLLTSLRQQNPVDFQWEILVVDNGDPQTQDHETANLCNRLQPRFPAPLRHIVEPEAGLHRGRNRGALEAQGEILAYLDDDMVLSPDWLTGVRQIREGLAQAVVGRILPLWPEGVNPDSLPEWAGVIYDGKCSGCWGLLDLGAEVRPVASEQVAGGNCFILRDIVIDFKGFHPDGMPDDKVRFRGDGETGFYRRFTEKGYRALYDPAAEARHVVSPIKLTLDYVLKRAFLQGVSDSYSRIRLAGGIERPWHALINDSYIKGQLLHREWVRQDPDLLQWVLRDHYMDKIPGDL